MDNFRKINRSRAKSTAIDGFVSGAPGSSAPHRLKRHESYQPQKRPSLGDFQRQDGFHAVKKGSMGFDSVNMKPAGRQPLRDPHGRIAIAADALDKPRHKSKRRWVRVGKRSALVVAVVLLLGSGYLGFKMFMKTRQILAGGGGAAALQENVDPSKLNGEGDGRINILLLGKGGPGHTAPDLTDTVLIASIDPVHKEAALVSIPRDFYVKTNSMGSMKINAVYATAKNKVLSGKKIDNQAKKAEEAGFDAIESTIESALGMPIHYHVMVDFAGFKKAIDAVGGVDVDVKTPVYEVMRIDGRQYTLNVKTGMQHFDGFRALAYSRSRQTSPRGDFDRAERQRTILVALQKKVLSLGTLSNPLKINELLNAFGNHVQTNFNQDELPRLYEIGKDIDSSKIESIGLADPPNNYLTTGNIGGQSVVIPRAGVNNYKELQNFLRNKLRDGFIRKEEAAIAVYNGTSVTGLAARTAEDLKSYGYGITTVADAPTKGNKDTILVDLRKGQKKYTRHYLEQRLKTTAVEKIPAGLSIDPGTADFVIILGTNEVSRLGD